jgi:3-methyladenine DNA glycosylase AlkC
MSTNKIVREDSLLSESQRDNICKLVIRGRLNDITNLLDKVSTSHAGTAKTKDKRFVIKEFVKQINDVQQDKERCFFEYGKYLCDLKSDNAKEVGISLIWRGYSYDPKATEQALLRIADDSNWEVREYAGSAFANVLRENPKLHGKMLEWSKHKSENVRRAVVFSSLAYKNSNDTSKAFEILSVLMSDDSKYVKKNLGPFILGSHFGNNFPEATLEMLKSHSKSRNPNVLWNLAMCFNNSFGNRYPEDALKILSTIAQSEIPAVKRAVVSTLRHLHKRYPGLIEDFCRSNNILFK